MTVFRRYGTSRYWLTSFKTTTNTGHNLPVAKNYLSQEFTANTPNQFWAADNTYLCPLKAGSTLLTTETSSTVR
jgi:hypothetical protein